MNTRSRARYLQGFVNACRPFSLSILWRHEHAYLRELLAAQDNQIAADLLERLHREVDPNQLMGLA